MSGVLCEKHGLICSMKTGSSEGSQNFGKTFHLCPLYPNECSFMKPSSIAPQFCKYHGENMIDLKFFKVLPSGEIMEYSRCKESKNTSRKFCNHQIIKSKTELLPANNATCKEKLPISSSVKEDMTCKGKLPVSSSVKEDMTCKGKLPISSSDKEDTKIHTATTNSEKPSNTALQCVTKKKILVPSEQQSKQNIISSINSSFRESVLIHSSSSESESDSDDDDHKTENRNHSNVKKINQKQEMKCIADRNVIKKSVGLNINSEQEIHNLRQTLDKKKKTYKTVDISKLPDKGARLKTDIESLESALNELKLIGENYISEPKSRESTLDSEEYSKNNVTEPLANTKDKIEQNKYEVSLPFSNVESSFETFRDLKVRNEEEISASGNKTVGNKAILIPPPLLPPSASFEKYRSKTESSYCFMTSTDEIKKKISDAMIDLQKSLNSCPDEVQQEDNPVLLKTSLLPHQRYALKWLLWRERYLPYGGILADDMGLGKSLTMVSLVLKHKENIQKISSTAKTSVKKVQSCQPTLVICPASLIHHWKNEILNHCKAASVETYVYHGPKRIREPEKLGKYDVVITTYETVRADVEPDLKCRKEMVDSSKIVKQSNSLLNVSWERIILDEAHKVKNPGSLMSQCIYLLSSKYRWAITGTPIHNNLMDLYSLVKFLHFSPFDDLVLWKKYILGMEGLMKTLVKCLLLRRTKDQTDKAGKCLVQLPPKQIQVIKLKLTRKEKDIYDKLHTFCRSRMNSFLEDKENKSNGKFLENIKRRSNEKHKVDASFLLVMLLRLQQCCCHLALLKKVVEDEMSFHKDIEEKDLTEQLSSLSLNNTGDSGSTSTSSTDTSSISCSVVKDNGLNFDSLGLSSYIDDDDFKTEANSTKVSSVLDELEKIRNNAKGGRMEKCVLVSQWVSFLEIMAVHIKSKGFSFRIISGSVKAEERMSIVDDFNQLKGKEILLLSLKAGGVGLNLVGGNHLFLLDTHWNPALENQACDRIYRLGQTKNVFIYKFICMDTIEEKIVKLQEEKLCLARNVLEGGGSKRAFTLKDVQDLLKF